MNINITFANAHIMIYNSESLKQWINNTPQKENASLKAEQDVT